MAASPSINTMVASVKSEIESLANIGIVHDRPRNTFMPDDFQTAFIDPSDSRLRAWTIELVLDEDEEDDAGFLWFARGTLVIEGWLGFNDQTPTDSEFRDLLDAVTSLLRSNNTIFGADTLRTPRGTRVEKDHDRIGSVLCHHCRIEIVVEAKETKTV